MLFLFHNSSVLCRNTFSFWTLTMDNGNLFTLRIRSFWGIFAPFCRQQYKIDCSMLTTWQYLCLDTRQLRSEVFLLGLAHKLLRLLFHHNWNFLASFLFSYHLSYSWRQFLNRKLTLESKSASFIFLSYRHFHHLSLATNMAKHPIQLLIWLFGNYHRKWGLLLILIP